VLLTHFLHNLGAFEDAQTSKASSCSSGKYALWVWITRSMRGQNRERDDVLNNLGLKFLHWAHMSAHVALAFWLQLLQKQSTQAAALLSTHFFMLPDGHLHAQASGAMAAYGM